MIRALWRDGVVYAVSAVLSRGIGLLLLPLVTRVLSPADYGALELIVTFGVLVNLVVPMEISQALARFLNERAEGAPRRRLAGTAWTFTLASHVAFAGACARPTSGKMSALPLRVESRAISEIGGRCGSSVMQPARVLKADSHVRCNQGKKQA